jgi:peptidoglycan/LPS O-acetylase OafA/YrhL
LQFFKLRLIRLHPLVIIGSVIGLLAFIFDPFSKLYSTYGNGQTLLMFITSCLLIPYPIVHERYFNLFHLNPPTWSLFWEYIANIFYVLIIFKLRNKMIWILLLLAAIGIGYEAHRYRYIGVGWGGDNILGGGIRVFYSFLAGILIYRSNYIIKSRLGFIGVGLLLTVAFFIPFTNKTSWITDIISVIIYFPFVIALGAGAQLTSSLSKLCKFLGDISYPLYMIHYPFLWLFLSYMEANKPTENQMAIIIPLAVTALIAFAHIVLRFLDQPIRKYLKNSMKKSL